MFRGVLAASAAMFLCASVPASAAVHNYSFSGTLEGDPSSAVNGFLAYDDAAPEVFPGTDPIRAYYTALTYFSATGADFAFRADIPNLEPDNTLVGNGTLDANDVILFRLDRNLTFGAPAGYKVGPASLVIVDRTNSSWTTTALPTDITLPTLNERTLEIQFDKIAGFGSLNRRYSMTELTAIDAIPSDGGVPEPASWAMMIAGFGLAGAAARRRQSPRVSTVLS